MQSEGFVDVPKPTHVCQLQKALYGLKQALMLGVNDCRIVFFYLVFETPKLAHLCSFFTRAPYWFFLLFMLITFLSLAIIPLSSTPSLIIYVNSSLWNGLAPSIIFLVSKLFKHLLTFSYVNPDTSMICSNALKCLVPSLLPLQPAPNRNWVVIIGLLLIILLFIIVQSVLSNMSPSPSLNFPILSINLNNISNNLLCSTGKLSSVYCIIWKALPLLVFSFTQLLLLISLPIQMMIRGVILIINVPLVATPYFFVLIWFHGLPKTKELWLVQVLLLNI